MSKRTIKPRLHKSFVASCGAIGLAVCCVLGAENSDVFGGFLARVYGQQQADEASPQNQVVYFSLQIDAETAPILASPSTKTYQTGAVSRGDVVEVYFRNENGYCAIRPPQGSYSWINGKFVQLDTESVGRVYAATGKTVPSRVGGPTPAMSSVVQVGLKNEQKVKILGQTTLPNGSVWYRIAPPPGEFRWIHESSLTQSSSLAQLPTRLTFQREYLEQSGGLRNKETTPRDSIGYRGPNAAPIQNLDLSVSSLDGLPLPPLDPDETFSPEFNANSFNPGSARPDSLVNNSKPETSKQDVRNAYDQKTFQSEITRLNNDVFSELQKSAPNASKLSSLQARAEDLFDRAPSDDQRFLVQSTFDAIAKAQIRMQQSSNAGVATNGMPVAGNQGVNPFIGNNSGVRQFANGQFPNNPYLGSGQFFDQHGRLVGGDFINGQGPESFPVMDGQIVGTPMMIDGQYVVGATVVDDSAALPASSPSDSKSRSKLGFAFSNSNNPFRKTPKGTEAANEKGRASRLESSFSHLPGIAQNQALPTTIVPPQNYNAPKGGRISNSLASSKLTPGPLRSELAQGKNTLPSGTETASALNVRPTQAQQQGAIVFQPPQVAAHGANFSSGGVGASAETPTNWKAVTNDSATPESTPILPASNVETGDDGSKIRPTSAFVPVTSGSFDKFETTGVLIELSNVSDGAPRYALLDKTDDSFDVVSYLDPDKNVSFDKFVGQKVVVKGTTGSVTVNGKTRKHMVVSSLFLIK